MPTIQLARIQPATGDVYFTTSPGSGTESVTQDAPPAQTSEAAQNAPVVGTWRQRISFSRWGHGISLRPWP